MYTSDYFFNQIDLLLLLLLLLFSCYFIIVLFFELKIKIGSVA